MTTHVAETPARAGEADLRSIPGDNGWPLLGHTLQLLGDYSGLQERMYRKYGPVHRLRVLGDVRVSLLGPEANELVFTDKEQTFSNRLGWRSLETLLNGALMLRDFEEHRVHRKAMAPAFRPAALGDYLRDMQPILDARMEQWRRSPPPVFFPAIKELLLEASMRVFLGEENPGDIRRIKDAFVSVVNATVALVRHPVPGMAYKRGLDGRRELLAYVKSNIAARRAGQGRDIFTRLCQVTDDDGRHWSDDDIARHVVFVMGAAHDTTSSSLTTLCMSLVSEPQWQARLREEALPLLANSEHLLKYEDLDKMVLCEYAFKEALRMYPPVVTVNRCSVKPFEFMGYTIPANTMVALSPAFTHMMPTLWTEPRRFDPMRFSPERAEDKRHRFAWVPFGGGAHQCIGMVFAYIQAKAFMSRLLGKFELALPPGYRPEISMLPIPRPRDGLPLILRPL